MGIRCTSNQAFWKAFCRKSLSQLLSICGQSSSKILLWVSYREMWSLLSCYCNTAPTRTFWAFSVLDMHFKIAKKHKPIKRRKSNITTASHICLKYFGNERLATHEVTQKRQKRRDVTATPENVDSCRDTSDWLKRDVIQISSKLSNGISKCNMDVSSHILLILQ